jgi:hypothetical protein
MTDLSRRSVFSEELGGVEAVVAQRTPLISTPMKSGLSILFHGHTIRTKLILNV